MSQRTIAVLGATGVQGGSVVRALLKDKSWNIRGITRDTSKDAAKALEGQGVEIVSASIDDEQSLLQAFEVSVLLPKTCTRLARKVYHRGLSCLRLSYLSPKRCFLSAVASFRQMKESMRLFLTPRNNQGVQAIFAVTNFWEHFFMGATALEARDKEID